MISAGSGACNNKNSNNNGNNNNNNNNDNERRGSGLRRPSLFLQPDKNYLRRKMVSVLSDSKYLQAFREFLETNKQDNILIAHNAVAELEDRLNSLIFSNKYDNNNNLASGIDGHKSSSHHTVVYLLHEFYHRHLSTSAPQHVAITSAKVQ